MCESGFFTPQRVLLLNSLYVPNVGGVENSIRSMAKVFLARASSTDILVSDLDQESHERLPAREVVAGAQVFRYPYRQGILGYWHQIMAARRLVRTLVREGGAYDVVIARSHIVVIAAWLAGIRRISYIVPGIHTYQNADRIKRSGMRSRFAHGLSSLVQLFSFYMAKDVVVLSENMQTQVARFSRGLVKTRLLRPGVDTDRFRPASGLEKRELRKTLELPEECRVLLGVGRFAGVKGFNYLIEALTHLPESYHLLLVGDGPERDRYVRQVQALSNDENGLSRRIRILPKMEAPEKLYRAADIFALSSLHEPFGQVLLEATAVGLPVVAFGRAAGVETATEEIYSGYPALVECVTSLSGEGLAEAIRGISTRLGRDQTEFEQQRSEFLAAYSWEAMVDRLVHPETGGVAA